MKKAFLFSLLIMLCISFTSCDLSRTNYYKRTNSAGELVLENVISIDKQDMYVNFSDYRWYESCIVLKDFIDDENCDGTISGMCNVFQYLKNTTEACSDVYVVMYNHTLTSSTSEIKHAFWVGDAPMNDDAINITFKQAFDKLMQANCPKPHSKQVVLRKELGPKACNPQYIFGNTKAQVYVDAVTGEVSTQNPAFPPELKMPLGEWP